MSLRTRIEAVLFVIGKAATVEEIAEILQEDPAEIETELLELIMEYSSRESALEIDDENGYIIQVREDYRDIVEKLVPVELKPGTLRTLSIIALKEPMRQSYLKDLRGAVVYEHVSELIKKGLIRRTKDKNGRSFILRTTPKFAEYFKLKGDIKALAKILDLNRPSRQSEDEISEEEIGELEEAEVSEEESEDLEN